MKFKNKYYLIHKLYLLIILFLFYIILFQIILNNKIKINYQLKICLCTYGKKENRYRKSLKYISLYAISY